MNEENNQIRGQTDQVPPLENSTLGSTMLPLSSVAFWKLSVASIVATIIHTLLSARKRPTQILKAQKV